MKHLYQIALWFLLALAAPVVGLAQSGTGCIVSGDTTVCIGDTLYGFTINDSVSSPMDSVYYRWLRNSDTVVVDSVVYTQDTLVVDGNYTFVRLSKHKDSADWHQDDGSFVISVVPLPAVEITGDSVICKGDSTTLIATPLDSCTYLWSDGARTDSIIVRSWGDFSVTVTDTNSSCKNTGTMRVTVNVPVDSAFTIDTCGNYTWTDGDGETYTVSGDYTYSHTDINGCTQVDTLHLTINNPVHTALTVTECETYTWADGNGQTYTVSGDYTYSHVDANGCTQVDTLHLKINNPVHTSVTETACESFSWHVTTYKASGDYTYSHTDINGCTQVDTLHLTIHSPPSISIIATADTVCDNETVVLMANGNLGYRYKWSSGDTTSWISVDSMGTYSVTVTDANNCSNSAKQLVVMNPTYNVTDTMTICASNLPYTWNGVTFTASGTKSVTLPTMNGCDSVVAMTLTVNQTYNETEERTICESELPYSWNGITFTAAGTQSVTLQTVKDCDSVVTMMLTVNPTYQMTESKTICASELPYPWNGITFTASGTQDVTLQTANGCDSVVTMTLTVNPTYNVTDTITICSSQLPYIWNDVTFYAAETKITTLSAKNGCDSVVTMTLMVNPTYQMTESKTICASELPYSWNGVAFTASGTQSVTLQTVKGCDSVVTMMLTVNPTYDTPIEATICQGEIYNFFGQPLDKAGEYSDTLFTSQGCDSVITLTLTVNPTYDVDTAATICQGDTFHFLDHHLTTAGNYTYVLQSVNGCDSVITLSLTVDPSYHRYITDTICQGNTFDFNGRSISTTGIYTDTLQTVKGCDSIVTLTLVVKPKHYSELTVTACDSYSWNDLTYTSTGDYVQTFTGSNNCDSIVTLHLTIIQSSTAVDSITACDSYTWINGVTYTTSNYNATYTLTNAAGCDSIVTLHLTVNYSDVGDTTAFACNSFDWYEHTHLTTTGEYTHIFENAAGCDSVVTLHLTVGHDNTGDTTAFVCDSFDWFEYTNITQSGDYTHTFTNASGCDSVVTLHLTIRNSNTGEIEAVACDSYDWYEHTNITTSGDYTHIFTNAAGCDSVVTLHLTVNHSATGDTTAVECESFIWHGVEYTSTPTVAPKFTYQTVKGCDSVVTLHLTIYKPQHTDTTVVACDEYFWNGATYTGSGTYTFSHADADGCIQVDTLHLTIYPSFILQLSETICQSELPYHYLNGEIDTTFETGTPQSSEVDFVLSTVNGCDSVISLSLTVVPSSLQQLSIVAKTHADGTPYMLIYPQAGLLYQWYRDGDAISGATGQYYVPEDDLQTSTACYRVLVRPDILHCGIMTDCWVKTDASAAKVCILPNPNDGRFRLLLPADAVSVRIFNANGQLVLAQETTGEIELNISADLANGLYMVQVQRENGEINTEKLVINR